jgi:gamma-butyrobetaine dioxygenase
MRQKPAATPGAQYSIANVVIDATNRQIVVRWADRHESRYHWVWLRHQCFYADDANGGPLDLPDDPDQLRVQEVAVEDGALQISWAHDGRKTCHALDWLRSHCYEQDARTERKLTPILWDRERAETLPWLSYGDLKHDAGVFRLLVTVRDYGFARIMDVPALSGVVDQVARHFGQANKSFRDSARQLHAEPEKDLGDGKLAAISPRTAQSFRHFPPGVVLVHCLKSGSDSGGAATLIDGFMVAQRLLQADADAYDILSTVPLPFDGHHSGLDGLRTWARVLCLDVDGALMGIRYCDRALAPLDLPTDWTEAAYRALRAFARELQAQDLPLTYRMRPGDLHVVDNHRVLHGRAAAGPGAPQLRYSAVSRDEYFQRYRALATRFAPEDADRVLPGGALG